MFAAIISTVLNVEAVPCLNTSDTVSLVPVDGAQVMLKGWPAVIVDGREVNVNGFCAAASTARPANIKLLEQNILSDILFFPLREYIERCCRWKMGM